MRVFVAGATGAIGARLVPRLVQQGHEVIGTSRSRDNTARLLTLGAQAAVLDVLDRAAVREAVVAARPDAIVHQATALAGASDFKHFDQTFAETNRLRTTARTRSSPPPGRPGPAASSHRATPAGRTRGMADP